MIRGAALLVLFLCAQVVSAQTIQPAFSSQDLGAVQVQGSSPGSATLTFTLAGVSPPPAFHLQYKVDFALGQPSCSGSGTLSCTVPVSFSPRSPGLRQDAVRILDGRGNLLATAFLHGVGLAPQGVLLPGMISDFAGTGAWGNTGDNGAATKATLGNPHGLAVDALGNVYIADALDQVVRKVNAITKLITTVAGNSTAAVLGDGGAAISAALNAPTGIALDAGGNLYIADTGNNRIRRVDAVSGIITTVAGSGTTLGDGGPATSAGLYGPSDVAVDTFGNLFIADTYNNRIRKVDLSGTISTVAGGGTPGRGADGLGNGGPAVNAVLNDPAGITFNSAGNLYIADTGDQLVRVINAGIISVVAGNGSPAYSGDGQLATGASLSQPTGVRLDGAGNIYIADSGNSVVRQVNGSGIIATIAGIGGQFGSGGPAASPSLNNPAGVAVDGIGNVYISDRGNRMVWVVQPWTLGLTLPSTPVGSVSTPQTLSIANIGNQALNFSSVLLTGNFLQESSGVTDCWSNSALPPATSCSVAISFGPQSVGSLTGNLAYQTNSLNGGGGTTTTVALAGTATSISGSDPTLNVTGISFGNQIVGTASASQSVVLLNRNSGALTITGIWISGSDSQDFSIASNTFAGSLSALASCTVAINLAPVATGSRTATLMLSESTGGSAFTQTVFLAGTGTVSAATINPSTVSFSNQALYVASQAQMITLLNTSAISLSINGFALSGPADFILTATTCGATLSAHTSCTVSVSFTPEASGLRVGSVLFYDSAANSPQSVTLSGTGATPLQFIPITPCRIANTRWPASQLGGPIMTGGSTRNFMFPSGACGIPPSATAYSINVTVVPKLSLGHLTVWPTGQTQPLVSTLNSDGRVKANAAIVGAGSGGGLSVYVTDDTDVLLDVNGYFVPAGTPGGLEFYPITPCRVVSTRRASGTLGGPYMSAGQTRMFPLPLGGCNIPSNAGAYSLNFTVVPHGMFGYLSTWPTGQPQPPVSTLNAYAGQITANAAIVPAGTAGEISVYVTHDTDLLIDINGYFSVPATNGLSFYALPPCRVLSTRKGGAGPFSQTLPIQITGSGCAVSTRTQALVTNATVVPVGFFGYLALWPDGQPRPSVSILNAYDGAITSNMAIVPTANGAIDAYATDLTALLLDVSGYFAP